ncbi:hypothetical protein DFP72DRAFT_1079612 [Ephemerocybe angulata]|uniref:Uncharacterized protein n=1 Tax=Ephemerocybe angulata TaxID=980116 RepID=A0A8H6HD83_9AGAR|nr:hypothetical protein DFP72DRAFT_1079612 [Tulosesus angulatus]
MSIRNLEDRAAVQDDVEAVESRSTQEEEIEEVEGEEEEEEDQEDEEEQVPEGEVLITRDTFIEDLEYAGATRAERMVITDENGENQYLPVPSSIRKSGIVPDGYAVDLIMDPLILVASLRKSGVKYESQLPGDLLQNLKGTIMAANNLCIVPISIWEGKLEAIGHSVAMGEKKGEEEEDEAGANEA